MSPLDSQMAFAGARSISYRRRLAGTAHCLDLIEELQYGIPGMTLQMRALEQPVRKTA